MGNIFRYTGNIFSYTKEEKNAIAKAWSVFQEHVNQASGFGSDLSGAIKAEQKSIARDLATVGRLAARGRGSRVGIDAVWVTGRLAARAIGIRAFLRGWDAPLTPIKDLALIRSDWWRHIIFGADEATMDKHRETPRWSMWDLAALRDAAEAHYAASHRDIDGDDRDRYSDSSLPLR